MRLRLSLRARLLRLVHVVQAASAAAPRGRQRLPGRYFIRQGYREREAPAYDFEHRSEDRVWQPDVYPTAARIAERLGFSRIVDAGCGNGGKLVTLEPRFEIVGIDIGENLRLCRERYPDGEWIEHDLDSDSPLPVEPERLRTSIVVCADVVEHLVRPERLLRTLRRACDEGACVVLSTPERELLWGVGHSGPPPNPAHVREWSMSELAAFLASEGFEHGVLTLTRSHDRSPLRSTILAVLCPDETTLKRALSSTGL